MTRFCLAATALNTTPMKWNTNQRHISAALAAARDAGVGILCLPELCITGYGCEDMFFSTGIQQTALELLAELAAETAGLVACFGLPAFYAGGVYNCAAVACDGRLVGLVAKQHLAGDGIHYEPRWFRRWSAGAIGQIEIAGQAYPLGDLLFDCGGVRIGLEICRDAWVADRTGARLAERGADVILNPSASHFAFAKQQIRERFVLEGSRAFCVSYAYCNLLGNEAGRAIYDGGTLIASGGKMLVRGPRFSFADWLLATAVVDVDATRRQRAESVPDVLPTERNDGNATISAEFDFPAVSEPTGAVAVRTGVCTSDNHTQSKSRGAEQRRAAADSLLPIPTTRWETGPNQKQEEFTRAVSLALFDYLRKSHARGFVVSLSGGADSSAVATLVHLMVQIAIRELGEDNTILKLGAALNLPLRSREGPGDGPSPSAMHAAAQAFVRELLTCVYQSTRNSGPLTLDSARTVAAAIGAEFVHWRVDELIDGYVATVSQAIGRQLDWTRDDLALQNIQARARGPGVWLLANLRGGLLLTTSNRSEAAVGYATMDGDTCGGLAPIAGIDKAFLLDWLKWMETTGPEGVGPLPALAVVNRLQPTAELRPLGSDQTDEGDLMPYRVLDAIERAAIRDRQLPVAVYENVRPQFPQHSTQQIANWVERFFQLWCRNQWKRERYAPSFHLDDENLDPKTWCRFPILNSGFEKELAELRRHVANRESK